MQQNQRRQPRLPFAVAVRIEAGGRIISGETRDISTTGLFLESPHEAEVGASCRFEIVLHSGRAESTICGQGKIVRLTRRPEGGERGIAVHFEDMDIQSQSLLWRVVQYNIDAAGREGNGDSV